MRDLCEDEAFCFAETFIATKGHHQPGFMGCNKMGCNKEEEDHAANLQTDAR